MTRAGRGALLVIALAGAACSSMKAAVDIHAPPERVWAVVSDVEHYHCWNPFFVNARGTLREGESLTVTMKPVGKDTQTFSPTVLEVKPGASITWRGRLGVPGLFDGRHTLSLERVDATHTRFVQEESFSGVFDG